MELRENIGRLTFLAVLMLIYLCLFMLPQLSALF